MSQNGLDFIVPQKNDSLLLDKTGVLEALKLVGRGFRHLLKRLQDLILCAIMRQNELSLTRRKGREDQVRQLSRHSEGDLNIETLDGGNEVWTYVRWLGNVYTSRCSQKNSLHGESIICRRWRIRSGCARCVQEFLVDIEPHLRRYSAVKV